MTQMVDELGVPTSPLMQAQDIWLRLSVDERVELMQAVPCKNREKINHWHRRIMKHIAETRIGKVS